VETLGANAGRDLTEEQEIEILRSLLDLLPLSPLARRQAAQLFASTRWLPPPEEPVPSRSASESFQPFELGGSG
jgi:hypothetical protein